MKFLKQVFRGVSQISYELTMSVSSCNILFLLYFFKWDSIPFKMNIVSRKKHIDIFVIDEMTLHVHAKMLLHMWSYDFYDITRSLMKNMQRSYMKIEL